MPAAYTLIIYIFFSSDYDSTADSETSAPFQIAKTNTWTKPKWFDYAAREYAACREGVAILDYSSFAKYDIWVSVQLNKCLCSLLVICFCFHRSFFISGSK